MRPNLDSLKSEIQELLVAEGFAIFHGFSRMMDSLPLVYWDIGNYPDYKMFVQVARAAGAHLMVVHEREFNANLIEDALEHLEGADIAREEYKVIERRLNDMRAYEGFTCALELSFDHQGRIYVFDMRTDWYEELTDLLGELEIFESGDDDEDSEEPMSGYFSKN